MSQVNNNPDPIALMPQISQDWGNNLSAGWGKSIDDYINGLIHRAGDLMGAGITKMAEGALAVGNAVTNVASNAVAPFKPDFSPSASPDGRSDPSPQHGLGKERSQERSPDLAMLGELPSPSTPSVGITQSHGLSV